MTIKFDKIKLCLKSFDSKIDLFLLNPRLGLSRATGTAAINVPDISFSMNILTKKTFTNEGSNPHFSFVICRRVTRVHAQEALTYITMKIL